jgi:hypothetical protein
MEQTSQAPFRWRMPLSSQKRAPAWHRWVVPPSRRPTSFLLPSVSKCGERSALYPASLNPRGSRTSSIIFIFVTCGARREARLRKARTNTLRPPVPERRGKAGQIVPGMETGKGKEGGSFFKGQRKRSARRGVVSRRHCGRLAGRGYGVGMTADPGGSVT